MDSSPIPSPAFTNSSLSTSATVYSTISSTAKVRITDAKNVLLDRASSFKVQQGRFMELASANEEHFAHICECATLLSVFLNQNPDELSKVLAVELTDAFNNVTDRAQRLSNRSKLAIGAINVLSQCEHTSSRLSKEIQKLTKEAHGAQMNEREFLTEMLKKKIREHTEYKRLFAATTEKVIGDILRQMEVDTMEYQSLLLKATKTLAPSLALIKERLGYDPMCA